MGQKVNPNGFRYGITRPHAAIWYAEKPAFATQLLEDEKVRAFIEKLVREYQIGYVQIRRNQAGQMTLTLHSARPGVLIGENAANLQKLVKDIKKEIRNRTLDLSIQVVTIERPELNARLAAEGIAVKLENRASYRAAQKQAIRDAFKNGAKGIKTMVSGRLNGVDIARTEGYQEGEMKLQTLRQDVDYAVATAWTTYGSIGVKVWISRGDLFSNKSQPGKGDSYVATQKD